MSSYVFKRLLLVFPTLLGILFLNFSLIQFIPGGPIERILAQAEGESDLTNLSGASLTQSQDFEVVTYPTHNQALVEDLKKQYGFDKPFWSRFWLMIKNYAHGNLGQSYFKKESVFNLIKNRLPVSMSLGIWGTLLVYLISIPLGVLKALRNGSRFDFWTSFLVILGYAIPSFLFGVLLILFFAGGSFWSWFPLRGLTSHNWETLSWSAKVTDYLWHMVLPLLTQVLSGFATLTLLTKNAFLEESHKQYVKTAKAKGCSEKRVLFGHIFRNASLVLIVGFPQAFLHLLFTGALLVEIIFSLDGIGLLGFRATIARDYPVVLGSLFIFTLLSLLLHVIGDLIYTKADPRIYFGKVKQ